MRPDGAQYGQSGRLLDAESNVWQAVPTGSLAASGSVLLPSSPWAHIGCLLDTFGYAALCPFGCPGESSRFNSRSDTTMHTIQYPTAYLVGALGCEARFPIPIASLVSCPLTVQGLPPGDKLLTNRAPRTGC